MMNRIRIPNISPIIRRTCTTKGEINVEPTVLVHGGAGESEENLIPAKIECIKRAAKRGYQVLKEKRSIIDSVEAAISAMEGFALFNAGRGSVLTASGEVELDASIMIGTLHAGAVAAVKELQHPINLARFVLEKTQHTLLITHGAHKFARALGMPMIPNSDLITKEARWQYEQVTDYAQSTVTGAAGVIVLDGNGQLGAGSSTGGINRKMSGRCGSVCIIGAGLYADDHIGAVVTSGHAECLVKTCMAYAIVKEMEHGLSAFEAAQKCIINVNVRLHHETGAIAITNKGDIGIAFNTKHMIWAYQRGHEIHFGVELGEHKVEDISAFK